MNINPRPRPLQLACLGFTALVLLSVSPCHAQDIDSPKFVAFAGAGAMATPAHSLGEMQVGAGFEGSAPNHWFGLGIEGGYVGPFFRLKAGSGVLSLNYIPSWKVDENGQYLPFATVGYTRLFGTGNALNYGGGLDFRLNYRHAIRFEVRDYYAPGRPAQHNVAFRLGWIAYGAD